jgi:hypothetical protein
MSRHGQPLAAVLIICGLAGPAEAQAADAPWKAGVATTVITPDGPIWMAGYAARNKPSEGKVQDLHAKALALEDATGGRLVIVTMDLIGLTRAIRDAVEKQATEKYKLPRAALLLNASHTHCGPVVRSGSAVMYNLQPAQGERVDQFVTGLQEKLVALVGQALSDLKPARVGYSHARCGFAMNRRSLTDRGWRIDANPDRPVDHDVPILRVDGADGKLRAVLFGYACHNTTMGQDFYQICGDYAGYAQRDIEEAHPGATALFITGCGGDQNPYPRGRLEQAQQHGRSLANSVEAALLPKPKPVGGPLRTLFEEVTLEFVPPSGRDELLKMKESTDQIDRRRAQQLLDELEKTGRINATYSYPIQVVQFGNDLTLLGLAGEVVVDYSLRLKRELTGPPLWVAGYCNDVFAYVPTRQVLEEGGYEGTGAIRMTRFPGPFAPSVEERIVTKVHDMARRVRGPSSPVGR